MTTAALKKPHPTREQTDSYLISRLDGATEDSPCILANIFLNFWGTDDHAAWSLARLTAAGLIDADDWDRRLADVWLTPKAFTAFREYHQKADELYEEYETDQRNSFCFSAEDLLDRWEYISTYHENLWAETIGIDYKAEQRPQAEIEMHKVFAGRKWRWS